MFFLIHLIIARIALGGTHVSVSLPVDEQIPYIGRKGFPTQNIMVVCGFDMLFTFVWPGWEGSAHDTRIFLEALRNTVFKFPIPPDDKYYLVDVGYPNMKGYLAPYKVADCQTSLALAQMVETAVDEDNLMDILDSQAGNWPIKETQELSVLGRKDMPDLKDQLFPGSKRLKDVAYDSVSNIHPAPPTHFICPILKDVMNKRCPCVAADGYTYDHKTIQDWLEENDKSPMTNLPLPLRNLVPNTPFFLLSWNGSPNNINIMPLQSYLRLTSLTITFFDVP
ncbi:hypothetical protein Ddye_013285 [Dipteronia dyeriana]|uniref:RING-type E3 ubiquitin transferase n=1 Tax=Dipteronia dyeriana TaxID=168575 RepID=A0AAD9X614_9ROSI|nr:hypothetical protein Ddye_013285 [Dipteronia dyeriana]